MPTKSPYHLLAVSLILVTLAFGCAESPTRPPVTDVQLSLSVEPKSGGPSQPVRIITRIVNAGETRVWVCEGCGCLDGVFLLGPDGEPVSLYPWSYPPLCPITSVPFEPGAASGGGGELFNGTLYTVGSMPSTAYAAPAGTYTAIAMFGYSTSPEGGGSTLLRREVKFDWIRD